MKFTFETFEILFDRFMFHEPIKRERFAGPITNRLFSFLLFCPKRTFRWIVSLSYFTRSVEFLKNTEQYYTTKRFMRYIYCLSSN